jgi:hypothetical protein
MKTRIIAGSAVSAVGLVALLGLWWAVADGPLRNSGEALEDFYEAKDREEDQLMDPLILTGRSVVPLVLKELPNNNRFETGRLSRRLAPG